jgi:hypothetical protein
MTVKVDIYWYRIFIEIGFLLDVYQNQNQISFIKNLFTKIDFSTSLYCVYLGSIFLGDYTNFMSHRFLLIFWRYLRFCLFVHYIKIISEVKSFFPTKPLYVKFHV